MQNEPTQDLSVTDDALLATAPVAAADDDIPAEVTAYEDEMARLSSSIDAACWQLLDVLRRFDACEGWASYGCLTCVQWLSWRLGWGPVAARERLRVAHALPKLPHLSEALRRGQVSFTKVRAITRVAQPDTDEIWLSLAQQLTGAQLEKMVRLTRRQRYLDEAADAEALHEQRKLVAYFDEDGSFVLTARLPPELGAVIERALVQAEGPPAQHAHDLSGEQRRADALVEVAQSYLQHQAAAAQDRSTYQVVVHVDAPVLRAQPAAEAATAGGASPDAAAIASGRAEVEEGAAVTAETSRRLSCDADILEMVHDTNGNVLEVGRRRRVVSRALKRALLERDGGCVFPSCTHRFVDAHHIKHWAHGGDTSLSNMTLLCRRHHVLVHEGGFRMERGADGKPMFLRTHGAPVRSAWLPQPAEPLSVHLERMDIAIDPATAFPQGEGERVDYDWILGAVVPPRWLELPDPA